MKNQLRNVILSLTSHLTQSQERPLSPKEFWTLSKQVDLNTFVEGNPQEILKSTPGISIDHSRLISLLDRGIALALKVEQYENIGIWTLTSSDPEFPQKVKDTLRDNCPPVIHGFGNINLFKNQSIGVVGSRNISEEHRDVAQSIGAVCAKNSITLVSGGAKGVDINSMKGAINSGGTIIAVLADSLLKRAKDPSSQELASNDQALFITNYSPEIEFSVASAMGRNKLIYGLSDSVVVVTSEYEKGGTWAGATEAIKSNYSKVLIWSSSDITKGNKELIKLGGIPVNSYDSVLNPPNVNIKLEQMTLEI
jgi:predicted Rossmann fold nucleotide-binding protein DprA/Smf involved in DNA uptake